LGDELRNSGTDRKSYSLEKLKIHAKFQVGSPKGRGSFRRIGLIEMLRKKRWTARKNKKSSCLSLTNI